ncbi:tetratricopeptide repeat protein [Nocardia sp. NPDC049149]|uniref:tetratricopeptide repeat protein n=1 Tax=Nocardia sp. NPDC049149 TaxID=3364315 RepID=UPI00372309F7
MLSSTLLLELAHNMVVNSLGESSVAKVAANALRGLWVVIVLVAVAYVGYRSLLWYRERIRTAHELDLIADLVEPGPRVLAVEREPCPGPPRIVAALNGHEIGAVLRELPVREFEAIALLAALTAALDAPARLPLEQVAPHPTGTVLLDDLQHRGIVTSLGSQRFCLRQVPRLPDRATVLAGARWRAALTALVHYYADRATRWAFALNSVRFAAGARRWFESEEPYLRTLITSCAALGDVVPATLAPELVRIGDALDAWHARIGLGENSSGLAAELCAVHGLEDLVLHRDLAWMRADRLRARPQRYRPRNLSTSLAARWEHRAALRLLATAPTTAVEREAKLAAAAARLEASWWLLPREDVAGEVCALINLAVVHIRQGRLDAAQDRLELAESLTRTGRDPDGRAHVHETLGIVWWTRGEPRRALRCWQQALTGYRTMADDHGTARCLQHLGSAMIVAPEHGGTLLGADPPLTRSEVQRQASGWLAEAHRLHPAARYAEHYAGQVRSMLTPSTRREGIRRLLPPRESTTSLDQIDRWPLPIADPAMTV